MLREQKRGRDDAEVSFSDDSAVRIPNCLFLMAQQMRLGYLQH